MGLTLLIGSRDHTWHEWLRAHQGARDLLVLDPVHAGLGPPARLVLVRDGKVVAWRFAGSLDPLRNPIDLLAGAEALVADASQDCVALLFAWRDTPLARHLSYALARMLRPVEVLIPEGARCPAEGWPVGPAQVAVEPAFPAMVLAAQRRARWMELQQGSKQVQVDLPVTRLLGARLGSGALVNMATLRAAGLEDGLRAELCGETLLLIAGQAPDDDVAVRCMNLAGASRVVIQTPEAYEGLVCSLEKDDGTTVALGMIERAEFDAGRLLVRSPAATTKAVQVLRIGALRVDSNGKELGETRPWSV